MCLFRVILYAEYKILKGSDNVKSETVDTVEKAIAGPILITSSIAVLTEQKCEEKNESKKFVKIYPIKISLI